MLASLVAVFLLACTCATEAPVPPPVREPAPQAPVLPRKTKAIEIKPLDDGVAVIMVTHPDYQGEILIMDGEEKGKMPLKVVTTPGLHQMAIKTDEGIVFEREVPVIQRRTGVLLIDLTK